MTGTAGEAGDLDPTLDWLVVPHLERLRSRLGSVAGLADPEISTLVVGVDHALRETLRRKITRVLVLEFNAARLRGRLTGADAATRWQEFVAGAGRPEFWTALSDPYPTLVSRLTRLVELRCSAAALLGERFAADRAALTDLVGTDLGALLEARIGAGDSHRGGQAVTLLRCAGGPVVYKPRPMAVDAQLAVLLAELTAADPPDRRIRVPEVLVRDGYGWSRHVEHRYCADDEETAAFYRGLGHWLAVMRLVGGTDLHAENLIAAGPVPVVVDCESVFTPRAPHPATGAGEATDLIAERLHGTVLRTGLLPGRWAGLGWRGVDGSGMGFLPDQQPQMGLPELIGAGTDDVRVGVVSRAVEPSQNLPGLQPDLVRHWPRVLDGFDGMARRISEADAGGRLAPLLAGFADCEVRVVVRDSEAYAELGRLLWHPAGLHDQPAAETRCRALLARHSVNTRGPAGDEVHQAEVDDLLVGDIPIFTTTPAESWLHTPAGTRCGARTDQVERVLADWRSADFALERRVTQAALVSAYLNQGAIPEVGRMVLTEPAGDSGPGAAEAESRDRRRRTLAAALIRELSAEAIRGSDGTVTWFAPVLDRGGWQTTPLTPDLYGGTLGVAVLLAGYDGEVRAGRADPVADVTALLRGTLATARGTQIWWAEQATHTRRRPDPVGGYIGLGSQIWCWLTLDRLGVDPGGDLVEDALFLADQVPAALAASEGPDVIVGTAGLIAPLLRLAERTGEVRWLDLARQAADTLAAQALTPADGQAAWAVPGWAGGIPGFAHGASGIGWALARAGLVLDDAPLLALSARAFAYERTWYDEALGGWRDPREPTGTVAAWCHGAVGTGLAAADLLSRGVADDGHGELHALALAATARDGLGWTHTVCHGDAGAWELLAAADPTGRPALEAGLLASLEKFGVTTGLAREVYSPSLLSGSGGVAYQLLRMHPDCPLPSLLLPGG